MSAGLKFKQAIANNKPLQVVGTVNAYCAMMAEKTGPQIIKSIKGDFFNVLGFPLFPFLSFLSKVKQ